MTTKVKEIRELGNFTNTNSLTKDHVFRDLTNTETPALNDNGELINVNWPVPPGESNGS